MSRERFRQFFPVMPNQCDWSSGSDIRYKENIQPVTDALTKISQLSPIYFTWKGNSKRGTQIGLIGQDVENIIPEVVGRVKTEREDDFRIINYPALISVLVEAVKELKAEVDELKDTIEGLKES